MHLKEKYEKKGFFRVGKSIGIGGGELPFKVFSPFNPKSSSYTKAEFCFTIILKNNVSSIVLSLYPRNECVCMGCLAYHFYTNKSYT